MHLRNNTISQSRGQMEEEIEQDEAFLDRVQAQLKQYNMHAGAKLAQGAGVHVW